MKTVAKIMLAVIMVFGFAAGASAQLTISDVCKKRAQETVGQLNDYIKGMVKKNLSLDNRNRKKDAALDLFSVYGAVPLDEFFALLEAGDLKVF